MLSALCTTYTAETHSHFMLGKWASMQKALTGLNTLTDGVQYCKQHNSNRVFQVINIFEIKSQLIVKLGKLSISKWLSMSFCGRRSFGECDERNRNATRHKGYNEMWCFCLIDESFMFEAFGHFEMVPFGKSVSFDVSIFLLLCIVYVVFNLNAWKPCRLPSIQNVLLLPPANSIHPDTIHDRNWAQSKRGCWNIHGIEMGNVTCVHAAAFSRSKKKKCSPVPLHLHWTDADE